MEIKGALLQFVGKNSGQAQACKAIKVGGGMIPTKINFIVLYIPKIHPQNLKKSTLSQNLLQTPQDNLQWQNV